MPLHLIKLCVGCDSVEDLKDWIKEQYAKKKKSGEPGKRFHRTRMVPKRVDELLDGGSLYWVIKGFVIVRQRVLDLRPAVKDDGTACCGIVLDPELVATRAQARRPFQGWRYLSAADAPLDRRAAEAEDGEMPYLMRAQLRELRLIEL
jgi:hypothetical protein